MFFVQVLHQRIRPLLSLLMQVGSCWGPRIEENLLMQYLNIRVVSLLCLCYCLGCVLYDDYAGICSTLAVTVTRLLTS